MVRIKRKDLKEAENRGLVGEKETKLVALHRHRRVCPACGDQFLPLGIYYFGFCCTCCAKAWGDKFYAKTLDRVMKINTPVVLIRSGLQGLVEGFQKMEGGFKAIVVLKDGRKFLAGKDDVEKIQHFSIEHGPKCRKTQLKTMLGKQSEEEEPDSEEEI